MANSLVATAIIARDGTTSGVVSLEGYRLAAIHVPVWIAADMTFLSSPTANGTFLPVYDDLGVLATAKVVQGHVVGIDSLMGVLAGLLFIQFVSTIAQTAAAGTVLTLTLKE